MAPSFSLGPSSAILESFWSSPSCECSFLPPCSAFRHKTFSNLEAISPRDSSLPVTGRLSLSPISRTGFRSPTPSAYPHLFTSPFCQPTSNWNSTPSPQSRSNPVHAASHEAPVTDAAVDSVSALQLSFSDSSIDVASDSTSLPADADQETELTVEVQNLSQDSVTGQDLVEDKTAGQEQSQVEVVESEIGQDLPVAEVPVEVKGEYSLKAAIHVIPHPAKVDKGGEDASCALIHFWPSVLCVADGVGGWAEDGVDPALYSREFVKHVEDAALAGLSHDPRELLAIAHSQTEARGASTGIVAAMDGDGLLRVANVGDSGLRVVRNGTVVFATPTHQHYFDCPFQFGSESPDTVADAQVFEMQLQVGDSLVLGSDGLFDNLFDRDIGSVVAVFGGSDVRSSELAASALASLASKHSLDASYLSPYAVEAVEQGYDVPWWEKLVGKKLTGGKLDDITVIVAQVVKTE